MNQVRYQINNLYHPESYEDYSKERLEETKKYLEGQLISANLDKQGEAKINNDIQKIGRIMMTAK